MPPSVHHRTTLSGMSSQLRHVLTIGKELVKQQYLLHMSSQYGGRRPTEDCDRFGSLGHPSIFQRVLCLGLLHQRRAMEVNQTLHNVWLSPGLVHYIHFWELLPPNGIASKSCIIL